MSHRHKIPLLFITRNFLKNLLPVVNVDHVSKNRKTKMSYDKDIQMALNFRVLCQSFVDPGLGC